MNNQNKNVSVRAMENITTFEDGDPNENPWVAGQPKAELIEVQAYDANYEGEEDVNGLNTYRFTQNVGSSLPKGRYPLAFVFFECDPAAGVPVAEHDHAFAADHQVGDGVEEPGAVHQRRGGEVPGAGADDPALPQVAGAEDLGDDRFVVAGTGVGWRS